MTRAKAITMFQYPPFTRQQEKCFTCLLSLKPSKTPQGGQSSYFTHEGKGLSSLCSTVMKLGFQAAKPYCQAGPHTSEPDGSCVASAFFAHVTPAQTMEQLNGGQGHGAVSIQKSMFLCVFCLQGALSSGGLPETLVSLAIYLTAW